MANEYLSPTAYWPADSDTTTGGGTIVGSVTYGAGKFGNAFTIPNSTGNYVNIGATKISNIGGNWSVAAWVNDSDLVTAHGGSNSHGIFTSWTSSTSYVLFSTFATNRAVAIQYVNGGSAVGQETSANSLVQANMPYHLAATFDGTTLRLYINGALATSSSLTHSNTPNGNYIGLCGTSVNGWLAGYIDELRVYNGVCLERDEYFTTL